MNDQTSDRYHEIQADNARRPFWEMLCPHCEARNVERDPDSDHPGSFLCQDCGWGFLA